MDQSQALYEEYVKGTWRLSRDTVIEATDGTDAWLETPAGDDGKAPRVLRLRAAKGDAAQWWGDAPMRYI